MTNLIYVPKMNNVRPMKRGKGVGSVLLREGGPGSASSYGSVEELRNATGGGLGLGLGLGIDRSGLNKKLESLSINSSKPKPKNIRFNF